MHGISKHYAYVFKLTLALLICLLLVSGDIERFVYIINMVCSILLHDCYLATQYHLGRFCRFIVIKATFVLPRIKCHNGLGCLTDSLS